MFPLLIDCHPARAAVVPVSQDGRVSVDFLLFTSPSVLSLTWSDQLEGTVLENYGEKENS